MGVEQLLFPDRDKMSAEEIAHNRAATRTLIKGRYYVFEPPIKASAIPAGGSTACAPKEYTFSRGWYLGFVDDNHVFYGKPVQNQPMILAHRNKKFYFHVLFIGGSNAILDENQKTE